MNKTEVEESHEVFGYIYNVIFVAWKSKYTKLISNRMYFQSHTIQRLHVFTFSSYEN